MTSELQKLKELAHSVGFRIDYIQGGGGNVSVKIDDQLMAIKASGYELKSVTDDKGFTFVNYPNVINKFFELPNQVSEELDNYTVKYIQGEVQIIDGYESARPSIETGFHSILDKYVLHSHSVYSNLLNCSTEGEGLLKKLFDKTNYIYVEYFAPGTILTKNILIDCEEFKSKHKKYPEIIFLKNHGIIIHGQDYQRCIDLHEEVTRKIIDFFQLDDLKYPSIEFNNISENLFESKNEFLISFFDKSSNISQEYFDRTLFPDQTVYFKDNFSFESAEHRKVNVEKGKIQYRTNEKEANTIEETLIAYLYLITTMNHTQLTPCFINMSEVDYINNMESEEYRKSMLKK